MLTRCLACSLAVAGLLAAAPLAQAQEARHPHWFKTDNSDFLRINPDQIDRHYAPAPMGEYYIGLSLGPVSEILRSHLRLEEGQGVVVMSVLEESSAAEAGLEKYDIVLEIDGVKITDHEMLVDAIQAAGKADRAVELSYVRGGEHSMLSLKPMKREDFEPRQADAEQQERSWQVGPEQIDRLPKELRHFFRNQMQNDDVQTQLDELRDQLREMKELIEKSNDN